MGISSSDISKEKVEQVVNQIAQELLLTRAAKREINKKIEWLQNTQSLEIEEAHKVDVLKEDMKQVLNAYHSFRNETKIAFKEKVLEAFNQINTKLNELSIKKER